MNIKARLASLRTLLGQPPPYCSGTCPVPSDKFTLFYDADNETTSKIDLLHATSADLDALANACQPASFGLNKEEVYDESYRKALKLDATAFAAQFNAESFGFIEIIRHELLEGDNDKREITLELYKLNVYGKGSFFKPHKDTPRHETMFGSLVVVFPTPHEGGEFVLRHRGKEWVVDFAKLLTRSVEPSVGYVAFFSDTEHEVFPVESGHRVTLTYNLYFKTEKRVPDVAAALPLPYELSFTDELGSLISDPKFMSKGGFIGFGLRHQYPITLGMEVDLLRTCLKGSDAAIGRALDQLSLKWHLYVLYNEPRHFGKDIFLQPFAVDLSREQMDDITGIPYGILDDSIRVRFARLGDVVDKDDTDEDKANENAEAKDAAEDKNEEDGDGDGDDEDDDDEDDEDEVVDGDGDGDGDDEDDEDGNRRIKRLLKVTEMPSMTNTHTPLLAWGNEPELVQIYGDLVLVASLPKKR